MKNNAERKCKKHRGYKGIRAPRTGCLDCWIIFLYKNPEYTLITLEILDLSDAVHELYIRRVNEGDNKESGR